MTVLWSKYCPKHQSPSHTCQSVMIKVFVSNYNCDWLWVFTKGEVGYLLANRTRNFHRSYNFIALFLWGEPSYFSFLTELRLLQLIMTQTLTVLELVVIESRDLNLVSTDSLAPTSSRASLVQLEARICYLWGYQSRYGVERLTKTKKEGNYY